MEINSSELVISETEKQLAESKIILAILNGEVIKEIKNENEKIILLKFLKGESLRTLSSQYGLDREKITSGLRGLFRNHPEELVLLDTVIESKKSSSEIEIDKKELSEAVKKVLFGNITQKEAAESLGINTETFRNNLLELVNRSPYFRAAYIKKESQRRPDYSFINFKALLLDMIRTGKSQSEMGAEYGIPARRISREIENLPEEDEKLKECCKMQAKISWRRLEKNELKPDEKRVIASTIEYYEGYREPIIIEDAKPKKDIEYERVKQILEIAETVNGTNKEKAAAAGVSVSTLRRARIKNQISQNTQRKLMSSKVENEDIEK